MLVRRISLAKDLGEVWLSAQFPFFSVLRDQNYFALGSQGRFSLAVSPCCGEAVWSDPSAWVRPLGSQVTRPGRRT